MQPPSKKIISVLIVCIGAIVSVWLFSSHIAIRPFAKEDNGCTGQDCMVADNSPKLYDENDWEKILTNIAKSSTTTIAKQEVGRYEGEGTETDLLAKDVFSQYLAKKKGGGEVSTADINEMVLNALSSPEYTKATGVQYSIKDIKVGDQTTQAAVERYMDDGQDIMIQYSNNKYGDPLQILQKAMASGKESDFAKLDPIIKNYKGMIAASLGIIVPKDAVTLHLALLNSISDILANLEALRVVSSDPLKAFVGLSQYSQHILQMQSSLNSLSAYFKSKGVI
jgi:hypothetical protein